MTDEEIRLWMLHVGLPAYAFLVVLVGFVVSGLSARDGCKAPECIGMGFLFGIVGPFLLTFVLVILPLVGLFYLAYWLNHCDKCLKKEPH